MCGGVCVPLVQLELPAREPPIVGPAEVVKATQHPEVLGAIGRDKGAVVVVVGLVPRQEGQLVPAVVDAGRHNRRERPDPERGDV